MLTIDRLSSQSNPKDLIKGFKSIFWTCRASHLGHINGWELWRQYSLWSSFGGNVNYLIAHINRDGGALDSGDTHGFVGACSGHVVVGSVVGSSGSMRAQGGSRQMFACENDEVDDGSKSNDDEWHVEADVYEACNSKSPQKKTLRNKSMAWGYFEKKDNKWHFK